MDTDSIIMVLVIGALAGWLAGKIMKGEGFGVA
ncbi:MAG: GlsB/YeaQ/YmgE family stress response membrane protein, partial [Gammaproteobacteria bacterium]